MAIVTRTVQVQTPVTQAEQSEKSSLGPESIGGTKYDTGKARFDLVAPQWEEGLARVMSYGAQKYADRNWEKGIDVSRCYAALRRHLNAFILGEDVDQESDLPHLMHAQANLMFLWAMPSIHPERDDRAAVQIIRSVKKLNEADKPLAGSADQVASE